MNAFIGLLAGLTPVAGVLAIMFGAFYFADNYSYLGSFFPPKEQRAVLAEYKAVGKAREKVEETLRLAENDPLASLADVSKLKDTYESLRDRWLYLFDELKAIKAKNTHKPRKYQKVIEKYSEYRNAG